MKDNPIFEEVYNTLTRYLAFAYDNKNSCESVPLISIFIPRECNFNPFCDELVCFAFCANQ